MLKAMIVDDEVPARSELRFLLDEIGGVEVAVEAASVREAIESLKERRCDVVFLDINMPGVNGMQFAEALNKLKNPPAVVFVTAYSEYGADAFGVNATDYLVKPVETERLRQAVAKVSALVGTAQKKSSAERIPVEKGGKKILVPTEKIRYIMAKDDYSCLYTEDDHFLSTISLAQLEIRLAEANFYRVHRRYIVNLNYVSEVESVPGGTLLLTIRGDNEKIPVSRRRVAPLKKVLKL
ncbi:MAG: response regulator transcription factor [Coriobacteriales bacterium]|nr:response regulator transcription factor [Coriobacteriales bacterium]